MTDTLIEGKKGFTFPKLDEDILGCHRFWTGLLWGIHLFFG